MSNQNGGVARWYHDGTKHPYGALMNRSHVYDPADRPLLYKQYPDVAPISLPLDTSSRGVPALDAIATTVQPAGETRIPDLPTLARLLHFSAGITKRIRIGGMRRRVPFRAAACTGALYHIEVYAVCGDVAGLEAGVYHFDVKENALRQLRAGDYRRILIEASGAHPHMAEAPVALIYTDVFWRNAIKYQAREYRHAFWDSGTILANTLAMTAAHDLPATVVTGFVDADVNRLLDLDTEREVALALVPVGDAPVMPAGPAPEVTPLDLSTVSISGERRLPSILEMHRASSLSSPEEVVAWRREPSSIEMPAPTGRRVPLDPHPEDEMPRDPIELVIVRRGSTRRYSGEPITFRQLSTILDRATDEISADFPRLTQPYLIVNAVDGLDPGAYVFHRERRALELLREGDFRRDAGHLALGQALGRDAAVNVYCLTDLEQVVEQFGNRGYRAAQLDASISAGRIYLATYAQHLGASGLTFFDDTVTSFFSPHAAGKSVMFLITIGRPAY